MWNTTEEGRQLLTEIFEHIAWSGDPDIKLMGSLHSSRDLETLQLTRHLNQNNECWAFFMQIFGSIYTPKYLFQARTSFTGR